MTRKEIRDDAKYYTKHYGYAYGAKRNTGTLTAGKLNQLARLNPTIYTADYKCRTAKNIGRPVIDCSGLVCAIWNIKDIGSYQIFQLPENNNNFAYVLPKRGTLHVGDALWRVGHCAIYIGNGEVVEAKGVNYGVRIIKLEDSAKAVKSNLK